MKNKKRALTAAVADICVLCIVGVLLGASAGFSNAGPNREKVQYLYEMTASVDGGETMPVTLPFSFQNLEPRTPVTLTTVIRPSEYDTVYIKSVYAPAKIYLNDSLRYEFGKAENYPSFMQDPATEVHMVETNGGGREMTLRMEFLSPVSRKTLTIHPPILGTSKEVILERFHELGLPFVLAITQMIYGLSLICIFLCILLVDKKGVVFLWLGLISLMTGAWAFGENNFTGIIFKNATFLYLLSFCGFFTFIIPLLRFIRVIVDFEDERPVWYMELSAAVCAGTALLLQLLGVWSCASSMYLFHGVLPAILLVLTYLVCREYFRYRNASARRLILPVSILALSAVLELVNYRALIGFAFSSVFQLGILAFLMIMGVTAGLSVKDSIDLKNKTKELAFEKSLMDIRVKEQESHSQLLSQHEQLLSQQRHDLRHHLNAILELSGGDKPELQSYLQTLLERIPTASKTFCENRAVNAIVSHYDAICRQKKIRLAVHLVVPANNPHLADSDLCIIFGNLLENAVEACERMDGEERFITINSRLQYDILTITMDNSFDGQISKENGRFRSSKRDAFGIGLESIRTVAHNAGGGTEFKSERNLFLSSVYVRL